jgi:hypothetical protein
MIEQLQTGSSKILGSKLSGRLHDEDYRTFIPAVETALAGQKGAARLLAHFEDSHGWDMHAAWDDLKFGLKHFSDFERIAMIGNREWEAWMARLCKPFTKTQVRYFDASEAESAWAWLREGV